MNKLKDLNMLQIGFGYWGPNLARNFDSLPGVNMAALSDLSDNNISSFKSKYPDAAIYKDWNEAVKRDDIDAVIVSTPAELHFNMALEALRNGKHVLVEKPLALTNDECELLNKTAEENDLRLMVGHTFLYNSAVNKLRSYIESGELGKVLYIYSSRLNLGKVRSDINSLWNFAPHDISIILYLLQEFNPISVTARGFSYLQKDIEDVVFFTIEFPNSVCANVHVSWIDPDKVRKMTVVGEKKMVVYDDVSNDAKIQLFDKGVDKQPVDDNLQNFDGFGDFQLQIRAGDMIVPKFDFVEPLKTECSHFVDCIRTGKTPLTNGRHGQEVVKILEAAQKSLKDSGKIIYL